MFMGCSKGIPRGSAECRLDLVNLLMADLGWLLQTRYLCKVFPTSSISVGFSNLENEDILC